jgi:hypothetical protein
MVSRLIRPAPFTEAHRLVEVLNFAEKSKVTYPGVGRDLLREWRGQTDVFDRLEAYSNETIVYQGQSGAQASTWALVTPHLLSPLGVAPTQGRLFRDGDGREGTDAQLVISERFWRESLGSIDRVVGSTITLNDRPHTVVGVVPATFFFPSRGTDLWLPVDIEDPPASRRGTGFSMTAFARIAPGVTFTQAADRVQERGRRLLERSVDEATRQGFSTAAEAGEGISAMIIARNEIGDARTRQSLAVLAGAVGFLLLIVCANVANLSLSRTLARGGDFAVRSALGPALFHVEHPGAGWERGGIRAQ